MNNLINHINFSTIAFQLKSIHNTLYTIEYRLTEMSRILAILNCISSFVICSFNKSNISRFDMYNCTHYTCVALCRLLSLTQMHIVHCSLNYIQCNYIYNKLINFMV